MNEKIIVSGFGGQGVMLAGKLLAYAGMTEGLEVSWLPSYGPEMRGGTANCSITLSDRKISSPYITSATSMIIMNNPSLKKFESKICKRGIMIINSSLVEDSFGNDDINAYEIPANELAKEAGSNKATNIVMLGAYLTAKKILSRESFIYALEKTITKKDMIEVNISAFEKGSDYFSHYFN